MRGYRLEWLFLYLLLDWIWSMSFRIGARANKRKGCPAATSAQLRAYVCFLRERRSIITPELDTATA